MNLRPLLSCALLALPSLLHAETWTLTRALQVAQDNSPDLLVARARVAGSAALVEQAQAAWLPQLSLSGRYTQTNSPMMAFGSILNQRAFDFSLDFNHPGWIDNLNVTGTIAYNLYSGGRATAGRNAARAGVEAAEQDLQAVRLELGAGVVRAYLGIRKAREAVTAVEAGVTAYEAATANARLRHAAGQMLKSDLLALEVQLAQTRESLLSARHGARLADQAFFYIMGLPADNEAVELEQNDPSLSALTEPATGDYAQRPELLGLEHRLHAAEAAVAVARGARRPTVNAFASYQVDHGWQLNRSGDSWMAGAAIDLNVFDGGQTSGRIHAAQAQVTQLKEMLRRATLGIELEVNQARLAHASAQARLEVTADVVAQAEESARLSRARFEQGALLTAELIGAESRLVESRMRRVVAEADERIALVDLRRAVGLAPLNP